MQPHVFATMLQHKLGSRLVRLEQKRRIKVQKKNPIKLPLPEY